MSGVRCINKRMNKHEKKFMRLHRILKRTAAGILSGCMIFLAGCGRSVPYDYQTMRGADSVCGEAVNPMVVSQTNSVRERPFAYTLCLPADVGDASKLEGNLEHAGLFDLKKKNTIYGSGLTERIYPASTTKLMTALVALKYGSPDQRITISENAAYPGDDAQRLGLDLRSRSRKMSEEATISS